MTSSVTKSRDRGIGEHMERCSADDASLDKSAGFDFNLTTVDTWEDLASLHGEKHAHTDDGDWAYEWERSTDGRPGISRDARVKVAQTGRRHELAAPAPTVTRASGRSQLRLLDLDALSRFYHLREFESPRAPPPLPRSDPRSRTLSAGEAVSDVSPIIGFPPHASWQRTRALSGVELLLLLSSSSSSVCTYRTTVGVQQATPDSTAPVALDRNSIEEDSSVNSTKYPLILGSPAYEPSSPTPDGESSAMTSEPHPQPQPRSSISMPPLPHQQMPSQRSPCITRRLEDRSRVRYSWQSVPDEGTSRPRISIVKLMSNTATASAGFPQGEALAFSISPAGRRIAAYNSARLYILQTRALPVGVSQDYALKRRPLAVEVTDDRNMVAILTDQYTVNVYDLGHQQLQRLRTLKLDFPTNCIALAPSGALLAVTYEGGIEVFSLDPSALPTDRRVVRSEKMDRMTFSEDTSTLLGTTTRVNVSSTVVISVPVFSSTPNGPPNSAELREAWYSDLLHPEHIRHSSHATFMREDRAACKDRVFAWNELADTFGVLHLGDLSYGNIDFPIDISPPLSAYGGLGAAIRSAPSVDEHGRTIAMVVNDRTVRLYLIPRVIEDEEASVEAHSIDHELDEGYGCPFSEVKWVYSPPSQPAPLSTQSHVQGRLVATSPGGMADPGTEDDAVVDIEGGRIIIFDFDPQFAGLPGQTYSLTLGTHPPQTLEEPEMDVAQEVAIMRRRNIIQRNSSGLSSKPAPQGRSASTFVSKRRDAPRRADEVARNASAHNDARRSVLSVYTQQAESLRPVQQRHRLLSFEDRRRERTSTCSSGRSSFAPLPEHSEPASAPLPSPFRASAGPDPHSTDQRTSAHRSPTLKPDAVNHLRENSLPATYPTEATPLDRISTTSPREELAAPPREDSRSSVSPISSLSADPPERPEPRPPVWPVTRAPSLAAQPPDRSERRHSVSPITPTPSLRAAPANSPERRHSVSPITPTPSLRAPPANSPEPRHPSPSVRSAMPISSMPRGIRRAYSKAPHYLPPQRAPQASPATAAPAPNTQPPIPAFARRLYAPATPHTTQTRPVAPPALPATRIPLRSPPSIAGGASDAACEGPRVKWGRKKKKRRSFVPSAAGGGEGPAETRSMFTSRSRGGRACVVM